LGKRRRTVSILLVEDDILLRRLVRVYADEHGCDDLVEAADGVEAMRAIRERPFDLVVLDYHMPRMNGLTTLNQLLAVRPETRVVAWTSMVDPAIEQAFLDAGAVRRIAKMDTDALREELAIAAQARVA
jgi:CheY-like chemotaxis protein